MRGEPTGMTEDKDLSSLQSGAASLKRQVKLQENQKAKNPATLLMFHLRKAAPATDLMSTEFFILQNDSSILGDKLLVIVTKYNN